MKIAMKSKYQKQILMYLLVASIVPVLILGIYAYQTYIREVTEKVNLSSRASLTKTMDYVDNLTENIKRNYIEIVETDAVRWLMENNVEYKNYAQLDRAGEKLNGPAYMVEYIESFSYIDTTQNWVFSNNGLYRLDQAENREAVLSVLKGDYNKKNIFWLNNTQTQMKIKDVNRFVDTQYMSLVMRFPLSGSRGERMLIIGLRKDRFENILKANAGSGALVVLDEDGKLIYANNTQIGSYLEATKGDMDQILALDRIELDDGNKYNVTVLRSNSSKWYYISAYDVRSVNEGADNILYTMLLLAIGLLLIIGAIMVFGARRIYQPMSMLMHHISDSTEGNESDRDEFAFIDSRFGHLVTHKAALEKMIDKQNEQLVELFILRLTRGNLSRENLEQNMKVLGIQCKAEFALISAACDYHNMAHQLEAAEEDMLRLNLVEQMPEEIRQMLMVSPAANEKVIILLINESTKEQLEASIIEVCQKVNNYFMTQFGGTLKAGISTAFEDLMQFRTAYNESIEAMKNNRDEEFDMPVEVGEAYERITFYSDIAISSKNTYYYELVLEKEVKEAVDECDREKAYQIAGQFVQSLSKHDVVFNEQYFYLHRFLICIILVANDAGIPVNELFLDRRDSIFNQFNQLMNYDEVLKFYKHQLIDPVIDQLEQFRRSNSDVIFNKIVALVEKSAGDITLTECAEALHYHPSYIWKIIKGKLDMTFTGYTALAKMGLAKKMLLETDYSIQDISARLNYTNAQNFIRFFSKHEGITPGKFRQFNKHQ